MILFRPAPTAPARLPVWLLWLLPAFGAAACAMRPVTERHDWPSVPPASLDTPSRGVIVAGFVGGGVKDDDPIRSEVKLAEHPRTAYLAGVCAQTFENRRREKTMNAILTQLGRDRSGMLSKNERRASFFMVTTGGSARVALARELEKRRIPVLLAVQVDSVRRFSVDDSVIPGNVARAADPSKTQILGNFRYHYKEHPIHCPEYPWYDRTFANIHTEMECDLEFWSRVEALIRQQIARTSTQQD